MVSIAALWLPILLAAVLVFVASSVIHMLLGYHAGDWKRLPAEDDVMDALRRFSLPPGDYMVPCPRTRADARSPEFAAKRDRGPVLIMTTWKPGPPAMGKSLVLWFIYTAVVGAFAGYVAAITLPAGASYLTVFRVTGTVAFVGYAAALWQNSIWYNRKWSATLLSTVDGLVYGLLTGGVFGWLWPSG